MHTENAFTDSAAMAPAQSLAASPTQAPERPVPSGLLDLPGLLARVPVSERTLRAEVKKGRIPAIRLPHGRRLLFHWPSVEAALLRHQRGGVE